MQGTYLLHTALKKGRDNKLRLSCFLLQLLTSLTPSSVKNGTPTIRHRSVFAVKNRYLV